MFGWLKRKSPARKRDLREYKEYDFEGVMWVHRPINTEQWSILQQIILELDKKGEIKNEGDLQAKLLSKDTIGRILATLLVPSGCEFEESRMNKHVPLLVKFPAEWTGEVLRDFFTWNPSSAISLVMVSTRSIAVKGIAERLKIFTRDQVNAN